MDLLDSVQAAPGARSGRRQPDAGREPVNGHPRPAGSRRAGSNGSPEAAPARTMRVGVVSTYPPRACGIGTFTQDLRGALLGNEGVSAVDVVAVVADDGAEAQAEVITRVRQNERGDYVAAARVLERRGHDVVVIQHEYGIFGGDDGEHVVSLSRSC
jgi:hypothetical protein